MRAVVLADRLGRELLPLTDQTCVALLLIAGKALIEHALDDVVRAGIKDVVVVASAHADQVRALVEDGRRWGLQLAVVQSRGEEQPEALKKRLPAGSSAETVWLRGDILRSGSLSEFLKQAEGSHQSVIHGYLGSQFAGVSLTRSGKGRADLGSLHWPVMARGIPAPESSDVKLEAGTVVRLISLVEFHQASLDAIAGNVGNLLIPGKETALGLTQGRHARVAPQSLKMGVAFVGSGSRVDPSAELHGRVSIADHVMVDKRARLTDTVVLPHTYIGELVDLRNAIIRGNDLIRVDRGTAMRVSDAFLLADLKETTIALSIEPLVHRLIGLALLLLSLPLWPLAALAAKFESSGPLLVGRRLRGNRVAYGDFGQRERVEFTAFEWSTRIPLLRYLPRLLAVINGDLRVVGVEPVTREQAEQRVAEWEKLADSAPAGLIGPTQLRLEGDASDEERLMSDAFYAAHRSRLGDWKLLIEGLLTLFQSRAWVPRS